MGISNSLNRFTKILGEHCAINQFVELSLRVLSNEHSSELSSSDSLKKLAEKNQLALTNYDSTKLTNSISLSYIVNIHLCFETFLKEIYSLGRKIGLQKFREKQQSESWLECVCSNIFVGSKPKNIKHLVEICEYYRLIRNTAVHDLYDVETREKDYEKLKCYEFIREAKFRKLEAPNKFENIKFDDSVMYARSCNELANIIYDELRYDYNSIILCMGMPQVKSFSKYKNNVGRGEKALKMYLEIVFKKDAILDSQIGLLYEKLLARSSNR